jgi:hypothetical protein
MFRGKTRAELYRIAQERGYSGKYVRATSADFETYIRGHLTTEETRREERRAAAEKIRAKHGDAIFHHQLRNLATAPRAAPSGSPDAIFRIAREKLARSGGKDVAFHYKVSRNDQNQIDRHDLDAIWSKLVNEAGPNFETRVVVNVPLAPDVDAIDRWISTPYTSFEIGKLGRPAFVIRHGPSGTGEWEDLESLDDLVDDAQYGDVHIYQRRSDDFPVGAGVYNNCLVQIVLDRCVCLPKTANTAPKLKKMLGLGKNDPVPVHLIGDLEDLVKCRINVEGKDPSPKDYKQEINIRLRAGHAYVIDGEDTPQFLTTKSRRFSRRQSKIMPEDAEMGPTGDMLVVPQLKGMTVGECQADLNKFADWMWRNEEISITAFSKLQKLVLGLFGVWCPFKFETASVEEAAYIRGCKMCGLMFCDKKRALYSPEVVSLDVNKMYAKIMRDFSFPTEKGRFIHDAERFDQIYEDFKKAETPELCHTIVSAVPYGIYDIVVERADLHTQSPSLFPKFAPLMGGIVRMTHYDVVQLMWTHAPFRFAGKALIWEKYQLGKVFGRFARKMLKCQEETGSKYAKLVTNRLWGTLSEKWSRRYRYEGAEIDLDENVLFEDFDQNDNNQIYGIPPGQPCYLRLPWVGVFITAVGRKMMNSMFDSAGRENIIRVNTDGFVMYAPHEHRVKNWISEDPGFLKVEARGRLTLEHINSYMIAGEKTKYAGRFKRLLGYSSTPPPI